MIAWSVRRLPLRLLAALVLVVMTVGCGQKSAPDDSPRAAAPQASTTSPATPTSKTQPQAPVCPEPPAVVSKPLPNTAPPAPPVTRDRLHQAFEDVTLDADNAPADGLQPASETISSKATFRILDTVRENWDQIRFATPTGKKIEHVVHLETNRGTVEITLYPEQAPSHARNFVALCKAGYYDGLLFERLRTETPEKSEPVRLLEGGCPRGLGEPVAGSIGYWMRAEATPQNVRAHEPGSVGACRGAEPDNAATRFYISLDKAPRMDGHYAIFGKVTRGLDVVQKLSEESTATDEVASRPPELVITRPTTPLIITKATVQTRKAGR